MNSGRNLCGCHGVYIARDARMCEYCARLSPEEREDRWNGVGCDDPYDDSPQHEGEV